VCINFKNANIDNGPQHDHDDAVASLKKTINLKSVTKLREPLQDVGPRAVCNLGQSSSTLLEGEVPA